MAATDDLAAAVAASPFSPGPIHEMTRGDLVWRITIPDDGRPVEGGAVPTLIEWPPEVHPTKRMPDSGCTLERLTIRHREPGRIAKGLATLGFDDASVAIADGVASLTATLVTPAGRVLLD